MNPQAKGYFIGALAAIAYGTNPLFALPLYSAGMDPDSVLFFRYLFAIPILGFMLRVRGRSFEVPRRDLPLLFVMGMLVALSSLALFLSYNCMDAGIASTLLFVYPILVALIMAVGFKEKLPPITVLCILLAVGGIGLLYRSGDGSTLSLSGTLLVFVSALSYAIYIVAVRQTRLKEIPTLAVTFYVLAFGLLLFLPRVGFGRSLILPGAWYLWGNLFALALFPTAISFLCTTRAIHIIGSTPTAILGALEPVTAVFFGVSLFGETLSLRIVCGICLIIFAVTFIIAGSNISAPLTHFRKLFPRLRHR
ncbi:MAG: DMT family transporter [Alistipes sp.]|nr:DMT family transporter [Alistipes sp.]